MQRSLKSGILATCRALGLFSLARHRTRDRLRILCYHGFAHADEARFRPKLYIEKSTFVRRMALLKRHGYHVLPLDEAVERLYAETLPEGSVAITIDDGFAGVSDIARDVLRDEAFPSTVYVTTYYVDTRRPIFRLAVQYGFWKTTRASLDVRDIDWLTSSTIDLTDESAVNDVTWAIIHHGERDMDEPQRAQLLSDLGRRLGVDMVSLERDRLVTLMNPDEVRALPAAGMDVQLHTHRHHFPPDDLARCRRELADNRTSLEPLVGKPLTHFCYPSGIYDRCQWQSLEDAGIDSATTCDPGLNDARTPRYGLRRFLDAENISEIEFLSELSGFSDLLRTLVKRTGR